MDLYIAELVFGKGNLHGEWKRWLYEQSDLRGRKLWVCIATNSALRQYID